MIKINLAKNLKVAAAPVEGGGFEATESMDLSSLQKTGAIRIFALVIVPAAMFIFEMQVIPEYRAQLGQKQSELQKLQLQTQKGKGALEEIKKFKEEQTRLQAQVNTIEQMKKDRLREVRILDTMQKEMPEKVWLNKIDLKDGRLLLAGIAGSDPDLTSFMDVLSRSAYLKEVNLIRSNEYTTQVGVFKKFEVLCLTER